jgi:hypothetical protein
MFQLFSSIFRWYSFRIFWTVWPVVLDANAEIRETYSSEKSNIIPPGDGPEGQNSHWLDNEEQNNEKLICITVSYIYWSIWYYSESKFLSSRLGGVMVSVLVIGLKVRWFKTGRGDRLLRAINIRSAPAFVWELKLSAACHKILRDAKITCKYEQKSFARLNSRSFHPLLMLATRWLLEGLPESSIARIRSFTVSTISHHGSPCSCITWGMNNRPVDDHISEA